jgi:probable O-glycosylation ligase (exosortase A-associated)
MVAIPFVPEHWTNRMNTIQTYEEDSSAMGRINAWTLAYNIAQDRITGGGFRQTSAMTFALYAPRPNDIHDAHSIYFEVLGELGFIGLFIYLMMYLSTWRLAGKNIKQANACETKWIADLMRMVQVALVAYASGGAFLGLAFWDLPYHLISIIILASVILKREAANPPAPGTLADESNQTNHPNRQTQRPDRIQET